MDKINSSNMVLRYYIGFEDTEERFNMMVDFLKRSGIRRVILFSAKFTGSPLPEEYYQKHAELLQPYIEKLREMGVETGINMLYTNGHCFLADEEEFGFRRAVTIDGEPSRGCVCMLQDNFLKYIKNIYTYYAKLKPSVIFTDDDIRMISMGQFICLCPEHIRKISEKVGRKLDLEEIRDSILSESFDKNLVREAFFDQLKEDVEFILEYVADCVHEISPDTEIGVMTTSYPSITADRDLGKLFEKLLPKKVKRLRTGMDFYREGDTNDIPERFSHPIIQRDFAGNAAVEIQPEIENDTYSFYMKSNTITEMQLAWCLTNGLRNMQLNLFRFQPPVFNYDEIADMFAENIDFHNKLTELIPENHRTEGIGIYLHPRAMTKRRARGGSLFYTATWYKWLNLLGMPVSSCVKNSDFMFLAGDDIFLATDDEIDNVLKKGAVLDLRAAESLVERGYGDRIGITSISKIDKIFVGERFSEDELNGEFKGCINPDYFCTSLVDSESLKDIKHKNGARILSDITNHKDEKVCDGVVAYENEKGERFIILPYVDTDFTYFTNMNHLRRRQLVNSFEWIARKSLPVLADNEKLCVNINCFENRNVITLFNLASDDVKTPKLRYKPIGTLKYVDKSGNLIALDSKYENDLLTVDKTIRFGGVLVIVDEVV